MAAWAFTTLVGCALDEAAPAPETSEITDDLLGPTSYGGDCTPDQRTFLDTVQRYGRAAVTSRAFEQCVDQAARVGVSLQPGFWGGNYRQCNGDPFFGQPLDVQIQSVLDAARSGNDVMMYCTGTGPEANASASLGPYDRSDAETLSWSVWLNNVLYQPRTGAWPYSQAAGIVWHESMHQHGYTHGSNNQADALNACGYPGDPTWNYQVNTMPYLLGNCVSAVLDNSATTCGNIDSCGPGMVKLVAGYGSSACECVADPGAASTRASNAFTHVTTLANTSSGMTTLDHPLLNGHAEAIVQFTHVYNPPGTWGAYNGNRPVAFYNYSSGRWVIMNQHGPQMPVGTGFFVRVGRGAVHQTTSSNTSGHITQLDHPLANNNPSALVTVSPTPYAGALTGTVDDHSIGAWFDNSTRRWTVYNQDGAPMPLDTRFTIDVETQQNRGLHFVHVTSAANRSGHMSRLSSPWLDGKLGVRFLVTPAFRGTYDPNEYGVWFDGSSWWIYNESGGTSGAAMPDGVAFNIEILKDELQRWIKVPENTISADTGIDVQPGDRLHIHGAERIWSGWVGSATLGPEGENALPYSSAFPLQTANRYSLIGRFASDGFFAAGRDLWRTGPSSWQRLTLRPNDDVPGNGGGFFEAEVRAFR
jgi:hypothetical protein